MNEDEQLYKKYYDYTRKGKTYRELIEDMGGDYDYYIKRITPDSEGGFLPSVIDDSNFFQGEDNNNVVVTKHNRYTPVFEHEHKLFELIYVYKGKCVQHIAGSDFQLTEGQFCLVAPNSIHSISVFDNSIVLNILIRKNTFEDIFYSLLRNDNSVSHFFNNTLYTRNQNTYLLMDTNNDSEIKQLVIDMLEEYLNKNPYYGDVLNGLIIVLFSKLMQKYEDNISIPVSTKKTNEVFSPILSYIATNYKTVSLKKVAAKFNYSEAYCSRLIKANTGHSFTELLQNIRFRNALFFLTNTNKTISQISYDIGFPNVEHFNRLFKKRYGITPSEYKKGGFTCRKVT